MTYPTATDDALTSASRDDRLIAGFAALAIAIHILEAALPSPLPGVKPALALTGRIGGSYVGPVGLSVVSALAHMSGQICVAYLLFIPHPALLKLVPILLTAALLFGAVSGLIAANVMRLLDPPARAAA